MNEDPNPQGQKAPRSCRRRRSEVERSTAAILEAVPRVLLTNPNASMEEIARAAGVSRQTVYAHFPSREGLIEEVVRRLTDEVVSQLDAAGMDDAPPAMALARIFKVGWDVTARYPFLWRLPSVSGADDASRHMPINDRLEQVIRRGQVSGEFDPALSVAWLLRATLALGNAATEEVVAGRMSPAEAMSTILETVLRLVAFPDGTRGSGKSA